MENVSDKWSSYVTKYDELFSPYKEMPIRLFEIGIQNGGSLEIWGKYFQSAELILGCDINPSCAGLSYDNSRIKLIIGDITEKVTLQKVNCFSNEIDIVIDDGSHKSGDIINTFSTVFPLVSSQGIYVIEDLHCSYWRQFNGGLCCPQSSISFFKSLIDILNYEHWGLDKTRRSHLEQFNIPADLSEKVLSQVHSVEFVNSMCIIKKKPEIYNAIGLRRVVGQKELVSPVLHVANSINHTPRQIADFVTSPSIPKDEQHALISAQQEHIKILEQELLKLQPDLSGNKTHD
jgi:hypothetical protein